MASLRFVIKPTAFWRRSTNQRFELPNIGVLEGLARKDANFAGSGTSRYCCKAADKYTNRRFTSIVLLQENLAT